MADEAKETPRKFAEVVDLKADESKEEREHWRRRWANAFHYLKN